MPPGAVRACRAASQAGQVQSVNAGLLTGEAPEIGGGRRTGGGCGLGQEGAEEHGAREDRFHSAEYCTFAQAVSIKGVSNWTVQARASAGRCLTTTLPPRRGPAVGCVRDFLL